MHVSIVAAVSLDGKIAQSPEQSSFDWTSPEDKDFFISKTKAAGAVIMGRRTFETIGKPLSDRLIVVMTRSADRYQPIPGQVEYSAAEPAAILATLEEKGFKEVVIAGGAEVYSLFLKEKLVTDLYLTTHPFIFGSGVSFAHGDLLQSFTLESTTGLGPQAVLSHYQRKG